MYGLYSGEYVFLTLMSILVFVNFSNLANICFSVLLSVARKNSPFVTCAIFFKVHSFNGGICACWIKGHTL
jgi:hypothetical protein